jgi:DNA-binding response OmpR family regulator
MGQVGGRAGGPEAMDGTAGRHVLVVEDEPNIAEAVRFLLSRDGWNVTTHDGAGDVLAALRAGRPDLLVLDVMLPGQSGFDILAALRADPETAALPVLMLTAKGQERDRAAAEQAGADRFMAKPFANAALLEAVRELAGRGLAARGLAGTGQTGAARG